MTKCLVTGGAGFVGSHIVDMLISKDVETYVLVSGFRSSKHPWVVNKQAHVVVGDMRNYQSLVKATESMDFVMHLASILSHYTETEPELTIDVNVKGTWNLKKACLLNDVKRIIFASSSYVYGEPEMFPVVEKHPTNPKDLFGVTKLAAEKILQATYPDAMPYTILRIFNVYGPRQYSDGVYTSVFTTWITKALNRESLEIHADGTQSLDFVYVEDVADSFIRCLGKNGENEIFNVGSGTVTSMNSLAQMINRIANSEVAPYYNSDHPPYFKHVQADIQKIRSKLGWYPKTELSMGLEKTVKFFRGDD